MICTHTKWVRPPPYQHIYTGEMIESDPVEEKTIIDIDPPSFFPWRVQCTQCGLVGVYTGRPKELIVKEVS